MKILVLNSGSSSQKACLYEIGETLPDQPPDCLWEGRIEWRGKTASMETKANGVVHKKQATVSSRDQVLTDLLSTLWSGDTGVIALPSDVDATGHRVVHGGSCLKDPAVITPEVYSAIADMSAFAPLHIQSELQGIKTVESVLGAVLQMAVFDTGFHSRIPLSAAVYPGPYESFEKGIRRYGFHGINHQYCAASTAHPRGEHLHRHTANRCSGTIGTHALAQDTGFYSRQNLICLLKALFRGGGFQRRATIQRGIWTPQPS